MSSRTLAVRKSTAYTVALVVALLFGVLALVEPAIAAPDVPATPIDGNKSCADLGLGDYELRLEGRQLQNGTYTDGTLSVTLSNSVFSGGELKSFDWSSNIGVDAVLVKAGTGENQYLYDPPAESKGDDGLVAYQNRGVSHISFCYDLELKVSKTAETSFTRTHGWEIDKSVSPGSLDLFRGDSAEAGYAVEATKTGFTDSDHAVSGTITVTNPNPMPVLVTSVTDKISGVSSSPTVTCKDASGTTVTLPSPLAPGGTLVCQYNANLNDGTDRTNTATATGIAPGKIIKNGVGTAAVDFGDPTKVVNAEIDVDDDNATPGNAADDRTFHFAGSGSQSYERTFSCDADEGTHTNTATIRQTGQSDDASLVVRCHELTVDKTAETSFTRTYDWTIEKSAEPSVLNLFEGDSAKVNYSIEVSADSKDSDHAVSGTITVTNDAPIDAPLASVTDQIEGLDDGVEVDCGVDFPYTLEAGEDLECTYSAALEDASERTNTATATLANGTGFDGEAAVSFDEAAIEHVNDEVDVDDDSATPADPSDDRSFAFDANDASETFDRSYERTFSCDADEGTHTNTATIRQTNDSDDASVQVNCYDLGVRKTADTSLVRKYTWTIDKSADQSELTLSTGQKFPVNYSVKVDTTSADSGYKVSGTITVSNPAPMDATLASVTDTVSGVIAADVECPDQLTVPAGGTLTCTYEANLPDRADRDNTATATLLNTPNGITDFSSASVPVRFANATVNTVDETITVTDSLQGNLGTVTAGVDPLPKTFNYTRDVGPYAASGDYRVDNVASLVTNDTGTTGEDDWTVVIHVPNTGCTLTIGYWKTHAGFTGNNADMVSRYLPISLGTTGGTKTRTVTTATQAVTILKMDADASNGINKLYAQLLAAKLNVANGADGSAVATTISAADTFLAKYNAASWSSLSKSERQKVVTWASKLDEFNNGVSGPGHCSEARTTSG